MKEKRMKAVAALPEGYREIYSVDMKKDRKMLLLINGIAIAIGVVMVVPMLFVVPVSALFSMDKGIGAYACRFFAMLLMLIGYIVLHELVHGAAMKLCGSKKVKYGFTGVYAFAGSDDYYNKGAYLFISLAPVVLWGVVLAVINPFVSIEWFWVIYIIQVCNISGAAGDLFVTLRFARFPEDILVKDAGVSMKVYSGKEFGK